MSNARAAVPAEKEGERGRVAIAKVQRYWAGKRLDHESEPTDKDSSQLFIPRDTKEDEVERTIVEPAVIVKKEDPRLARLARTDTDDAKGAGHHRHRRHIQEAVVVSTAKETSEAHRDPLSDSHPENAQTQDVAAERQARRERALIAQQEQQAKEQNNGSESEYETDDESEETGSSDDEHRMAKPVFVPKGDRETVVEKERVELEAMQLKEDENKRQEKRVTETSEMVAALVDQEKQAAATKKTGQLNTASDIDTDSDTDEEEAEFEKWKRRELERIKREEAMRDPSAKEEKPITQSLSNAARGKMKFMQKYYHKGAFFQTEADDDRGTVGGDAIYTRDFTGATGEDKFDKESLPTVMQVKNFGRAGRTKWTHLANEDTTFAGQKRPGVSGMVEVEAEVDVFSKVRQAVEAKGAGRAGALGDELAKPKRTRT